MLRNSLPSNLVSYLANFVIMVVKRIKRVAFLLLFFYIKLPTFAQSPFNYNGFKIDNPSIPKSEIRHGGPGRDGIPSIDNPKFLSASNASYLKDNDRILGVSINGVSKGYPIRIMDYHEIVNDQFNGKPVVITYCPLCGSGISFDAKIDGQKRTFGVSGLLYNSDVLLYDHETQSLWSQIMFEAISGPSKGKLLNPIITTSTTWEKWKALHPDTKVLSTETGHSRNYDRSPYGNYNQERRLYFPVKNQSDKYHPKELVIGINIGNKYKAYPFSELENKGQSQISDSFNGQELIIEYDKSSGYTHIKTTEGKELPGTTLFWFAWYAFHPDTEIYIAN